MWINTTSTTTNNEREKSNRACNIIFYIWNNNLLLLIKFSSFFYVYNLIGLLKDESIEIKGSTLLIMRGKLKGKQKNEFCTHFQTSCYITCFSHVKSLWEIKKLDPSVLMSMGEWCWQKRSEKEPCISWLINHIFYCLYNIVKD